MAAEVKMDLEQVLKALCEKETEAKGKYLEDVKFLYESVQKGTYSRRDHLCDALAEYLETVDPAGDEAPALGKKLETEDKDEEAVFLMLNQVLSLENAPLGKWPGKDGLGIWQQADVNLAIHKGTEDAFEEVGKIVASRAKKDEEKEAVLKGLLANAVVERASLLARYDKPDEAFESFDFYHGEEKNHAYAEFPAKWHRIREDRLNDESILVTAATDAPIRKLTKDLESKEKTMGLLAASISDEVQKSIFYEMTIAPMVKAYREDDVSKTRLPKYVKTREEFLAQKKLVEDLREKLGKLQKEFLRNWKEEKQRTKDLRAAEAAIEHAEKDAEAAEQTRKPLMDSRDGITKQMNELLDQIDEIAAHAQATKNEWTHYNDVIRTGFDKERELRESVNGMTKLLNKKKYEAVMEQADQVQKEAIEAQEKAPAADKKLKELTAQYDEMVGKKEKLQKDLDTITDKISQISKTVNGARAIIAKRSEEADQLRHALEAVEKERKALLDEWAKEQGEDRRILLDVEFVKELLSKDAKVREKKEAENPWFNQKYQKEREKLFDLALALQKAFVEASGCCMANLATLSQYWGYWKKGNEKITFHEADVAETVPFLWQTLALLVPVIELALPAVAGLLGDVKQPGLFGTLVVDTEGKLPAVKAIGTLYRSRSAVAFK